MLYFWTGIRNIEADAADDLPPETIPNEADFLLGYATIPGFVSYRSRSMGSWYITKLVEMLDKYANKWVQYGNLLHLYSSFLYPI